MSNSIAKRVLREMALDLGDTPDYIDPQKKRQIQQRQDPFSQNPAFPQAKPARRPGAPYRQEEPPERRDPTQHYGELVASHVYPEIMRKVQRYTGRDPRRSNPGMLAMEMQQALMQAMQLEGPHRQQLEQAAVRVILGLPEFTDARAAVESGDLRIDAHLVNPNEMHQVGQRRADYEPEQPEPQGEAPEEEPEEEENERGQGMLGRMNVEPEEPDDEQAQEMGLHVPQIRQEYDAEVGKRRFVNALIQGAAINKNYAYHEIADELQAIDPDILNLYGKAMSIAELMYWAMPEQMLNTMMGGGGGAGGMEEISLEDKTEPEYGGLNPDLENNPELPGQGGGEGGEGEDGGEGGEFGAEGQPEQEAGKVWVVRAYAICFPVLLQEITKGLYEFLAHNEDDPDEVRAYAYGKSDTLGNEQWDIMQGPGIWRHLNHLVNQANGAQYMGRVFRHLVTLPTGEFNQMMRDILSETPRGRQYITNLVNEIRAEDEGRREESLARRIIRNQE